MKFTYLILVFVVALTTACASVYKPSNSALKMKSGMSQSQALQYFKSSIITKNEAAGLCKGLGIDGKMGAPTWFINRKKPELKVTKNGFGFNAAEQKIGYTLGMYGSSNISSISYSEIKKSYKFSQIESALLKQSGSMLACTSVKGYTEIVLFVSTGIGHAVIFLVPNAEIDRFIASMMILVPGIKLETK